ncbi:MAG: hypothetical protein AVDCRST_MAG69-687 [uncultured Solirubrobacteraceae bacterium]|uniref:Uncharacterized protein n=1 Tax=uncultured Solirubrobacteraceae bacterium TaxID=1162706 RepID=A0A6J4S082_9ACTN|nr:MAG: hypothetical protein AVDCRST_MAG69-687 [uncultured Solirubrobacteraceae bacterium]
MAMANPRRMCRARALTGPVSAMAMNPATMIQPIGRRSR